MLCLVRTPDWQAHLSTYAFFTLTSCQPPLTISNPSYNCSRRMKYRQSGGPAEGRRCRWGTRAADRCRRAARGVLSEKWAFVGCDRYECYGYRRLLELGIQQSWSIHQKVFFCQFNLNLLWKLQSQCVQIASSPGWCHCFRMPSCVAPFCLKNTGPSLRFPAKAWRWVWTCGPEALGRFWGLFNFIQFYSFISIWRKPNISALTQCSIM